MGRNLHSVEQTPIVYPILVDSQTFLSYYCLFLEIVAVGRIQGDLLKQAHSIDQSLLFKKPKILYLDMLLPVRLK